MTNPNSSDERRKLVWARVYHELVRHAIPDSRFNFDFLSFTPDFRDSASAVERVRALPCYKSATTILVTSDNSLEQLRFNALKDGKKVLVATYRLRRGFVLVDPARIGDGKFELAACLDGMEKPGIGRSLTMSQIRDEGIMIDLCATGVLAISEEGVVIWEGQDLFEVQWALLNDVKSLTPVTPVVAIAHSCQVVSNASEGADKFMPTKSGEVQCDFVITPEKTIAVEAAIKPTADIDFSKIDVEAMNSILPLQELKGIRMAEQIMKLGGFGTTADKPKEEAKAATAEEQMGMDIVAKLMKGYKA